MDGDMWMIIGAIVVLVFVAGLFKQNAHREERDDDRGITHDVGSWGSDGGSAGGDSVDSSNDD